MPVQDLREWIAKTDAMGEIKRIDGADWQSEIGALTNLYQRQPGLPALLFDEIPGYPKGYRLLANALSSFPRHGRDVGDAAVVDAHGDRGTLAQGDERGTSPCLPTWWPAGPYWRTCSPAMPSICSNSPRPSGTSWTAAAISAPAT